MRAGTCTLWRQYGGTVIPIVVNQQRIVLFHYEMRVGPRSGYGSMASLRVLHGNLPDDPLAGSLDVGVDGHNFRPFDEISERMGQKKLIGFREEL